ncbi:SusC/RagA family TonB-linked outer membrane protein [Empedobacter falsenii]|uniref:SusC/RagA family TonB-linked outer membrane protein n=1 Tax=Empedobacter falsenii TaxID=343874 RepID=UPI00257910A2|nr:SusC/RagA family TonB-linked outer membrane protein [Empedobacter falsenii]MDM1062703.1 SusC/RagA family TonB-linked outer membrane protein [Empedobacter falsenii]
MRRRITSLSLLAFLGLGTAAFAQVTGVVNDADNFPEADVEVSVKGTDKVVYTDQDGKFDIDAKIGDILVVNGKEFSVTSNALGTLKYAAATNSTVDLSEVVVKSIFNAPSKSGVTTVKAKDLEQMNPSVSIDQMIGGKVAGLSSQAMSGAPGATANVTIRGAIGLNGGVKSPLYVVDGTYMSAEDVNAINPADIEEVKVLKDASQLAIFGSRGANGVIIMKTKSAKKGESTISYSARIGMNEMMDLPNIHLMNANQLLNYQNGLSKLTDANGEALGLGIARSAEDIASLSKNNHKWSDDLYKNGLTASHFVSVNKNDGDTAHNFSIGYDKNEGAVRYYDGMERITASLNITSKAKDWLRYGINLNGSYTTLDSPRDRVNAQSPFYNTLLNRPYTTFYKMNANGGYLLDADGNRIYNSGGNTMGYAVADEMENTDAQTRYLRIYGTSFVEADLWKNVSARTTLGATYNRIQYENYLKPSAALSQLLGDGGSKTDRSTDRFDYNWRNEVSYENTFGGKHHLRVTAASEYINQSLYSMTMYGSTFPNDNLSTQGLAVNIGQDSFTNRWRVTKFGYLGAASYDFANKYFVDAYIRRDGTSLAGLNSKYGTFWGAALGWNIAKEGFLRDSKVVNNLTLKASYGEVGDDSAIARYANLTLLQLDKTYNGQATAFPDGNLSNLNTTWETNRKLNIGLDYGFFGNRLTGALAYFNDVRSNFIFNQYLPVESGGFTTYINAGKLATNGFEFDMNYDVVRSKNFDLSVYGNVTTLKYKVNKLADGQDMLLVNNSYESLAHVAGGKPYQFYLVRYAGVDSATGKDLYLDKDGNVTDTYDGGDAVATNKTPLPTLMGGFGLNAKFYGFDINADFTYSAGGYMYNNTYQYLTDPVSTNNKVVEAANYWTTAGDNAQFSRPTVDGTEYSTKYLEKSDYIAFRSLSLGYNFTDLVKGTFIKNLRMYAQVQNLALWTNYHGNPIAGTGTSESSTTTSAGYVSNSFTAFSYPLVRSYSVGFNVSF